MEHTPSLLWEVTFFEFFVVDESPAFEDFAELSSCSGHPFLVLVRRCRRWVGRLKRYKTSNYEANRVRGQVTGGVGLGCRAGVTTGWAYDTL